MVSGSIPTVPGELGASRRIQSVIPVHWATFDLALHGWTEPGERVLVAARRAGIPLARPRPGQSVEPATPPAVERWWPELKWKSAEERPIVSSGVGGARGGPGPRIGPLDFAAAPSSQ